MERLRANLQNVQGRMADAAQRAGRNASEITLVAVTKRTPSAWARELAGLGATDLGENYPQELWSKAEDLADLPQIDWHLIGHLQTNKLRRTLPLVTMIHAVDSLKLLAAIAMMKETAPRLSRICLQVNVSGESAKHGWSAASLLEQSDQIAELIRRHELPVTGLMTMAAWGTDAESARPAFAELRTTAEELGRRTGLVLPDLSMGMSGDFETAIEEGATFIRVGSSLFEGLEEA